MLNTNTIEPTTIAFHTKMRSKMSSFVSINDTEIAKVYWEWLKDNQLKDSVEIIKSMMSYEIRNFYFNADTNGIKYSNVLKQYALLAPNATKIASDPSWIDEVVSTNLGNVTIPDYLNIPVFNIASMLVSSKIETQLDSSIVCTYDISSGDKKVLKDKDGSYFQNKVVENTVVVIIDSINDQLTVTDITCTGKQMKSNNLKLNKYSVRYEHYSSYYIHPGDTDSILATSLEDAIRIASILHDSPENGERYFYEASDNEGNLCEGGNSKVSHVEAIEKQYYTP